jgi:hypothetical protein
VGASRPDNAILTEAKIKDAGARDLSLAGQRVRARVLVENLRQSFPPALHCRLQPRT